MLLVPRTLERVLLVKAWLSEAGRTLLAGKEVTAKLKDERAQFVCQHEAHHECTDSRQFKNLSIMTELKYRPSVNESDKTVQEWILHLDEQTQVAVHFHQMIKLVLSIDDDDLLPLSERREGRERNVEDVGNRLRSENGTYMLNGNVDAVLARVDWFSFDIPMEKGKLHTCTVTLKSGGRMHAEHVLQRWVRKSFVTLVF